MYLYTVKNIIYRHKKVLSSIQQVEKYTRLTEQQIRTAIKLDISIGQWRVERDLNIKTKKKKEPTRLKHQADDGYIAIKEEEVKYFPDKKSASKYTGVAQNVIDDCIIDGGSAKGWFFDYALKREQP